MTQWLIAEHLASDQYLEHLKVPVAKRFRACKIEPPTNERCFPLLDQFSHYSCPARLMTGTQASTRITMKLIIEKKRADVP
ncbi:MAG: hypothetical protein M3Y81_00535 [Chloroflexota bacterium]|nr:hypothetical protein [Chloroflexota bacterium]